ncbi:DUF262 domain-containing protein [Candidatus Methanarcanum hacksteinii]|uniref:DUF262 domain-containing protein n=1 Tax=Candidatus Methanarcanum hacksteinii TaxID=2911857 RepID=UPI0037DD12BD
MTDQSAADIEWEKWDLETMMTKTISVPIYQRPYAWEEEQVKEFLKDLDYFAKTKYQSYLFGLTIVMKRVEEDSDGTKIESFELIDGQQRLTTALIFISVVRDIATELILPNLDSFRTVAKRCLGGVEFSTEEYHLTLGKINRQYFLENIQKYCDPVNSRDGQKHIIEEPEKTSPSNYKIWKSYQTIYEHLIKKIEGKPPREQSKILEDYLSNLTKRFKLSAVITKDLGQSYIIFETFNSRGLDLDATDLLKNYFFMICKEDKDVVDGWTNMVDALNDKKEAPTDYIRCYWNSIHVKNDEGFCRKKQLFQFVKDLVDDDKTKAKQFLTGLFKQYPVYLAMRDLDDQTTFKTDDQKKPLDCLRKFNLRTFYPLVLALKTKVTSENKLAESFSKIESLIIRNMIVGGDSPNSFETKFAIWASSISSGKDVDSIMKLVEDETRSDSQFKNEFDTFVPGSDTTAKILLWNIYNEDYKERPIPYSPFKLHLEHIMPQDNKQWKVNNQIHSEYVNHIGNMSLLNNKLNIGASNLPLEDKRAKYIQSDLKQNIDLSKVSTAEWTADMIQARQEYFFDVAMRRWPVKDKSKKDLTLDLKDNLWKNKIEGKNPESKELIVDELH